MSKTKQLIHIVFATKQREMTISESSCDELYRFIGALFRDIKCYVIRVNGIENHIHILTDLHPNQALAPLVKKLKHDTSVWMINSGKFPKFRGWCDGYYACSISPKVEEAVVAYIDSQKEHHKKQNMEDELITLIKSAGIEYTGYTLD
jgi:REP element-mobilizing transposase RayT